MYSSTAKTDIREDELNRIDRHLLGILLQDKTTKTNIIWATDDYAHYGREFESSFQIMPEQISLNFPCLIQPRICKDPSEQSNRTKQKAEVFTPSWVCNIQNNLIDASWFGYENVFNITCDKDWKETNRIFFPKDKHWQRYVDTQRLEISCGEAPYLVSRYDTVSGKTIEIGKRIGLLDRKLRVVNENVNKKQHDEWVRWAIRAVQSVFGYEFQGDNLLLARENVLFTFIDYYEDRFGKDPEIRLLKQLANIISWNIFQMDGLTLQVPFPDSGIRNHNYQTDLFGINDFLNDLTADQNHQKKANNYYCRVFDWRSKQSIEFRSLLKQK